MRINVRLLSAIKEKDPERAIIPALVYTELSDNLNWAKMISLGWWAWGIGLVFSHKVEPRARLSEKSR